MKGLAALPPCFDFVFPSERPVCDWRLSGIFRIASRVEGGLIQTSAPVHKKSQQGDTRSHPRSLETCCEDYLS